MGFVLWHTRYRHCLIPW